MNKLRLLPIALVLALLGAVLTGCGGDDDDGDTAASTAATPATQESGSGAGDKAGAEPGGGSGSAGAGSSGDGKGGSAVDTVPDSLEVNPRRIRNAIVTDTGAVQTLEPNPADHQEAMDNSYSSIKAFGEEVTGEEATNITFALVQYLTAKAEGDWATACARLYGPLRDNFAKMAEKAKDPALRDGGCAAAYGELMKRASKSSSAEAAKIDVASIRRGEGNRAFVIYKSPDTLSADMPMYVEDGIWTVGAIQAYVLTPEQVG